MSWAGLDDGDVCRSAPATGEHMGDAAMPLATDIPTPNQGTTRGGVTLTRLDSLAINETHMSESTATPTRQGILAQWSVGFDACGAARSNPIAATARRGSPPKQRRT